MKNEREDIKWLNEYPMLKQVNPDNAFKVPPGYFNELEAGIERVIRLEGPNSGDVNKGFVVPVNYFEELTKNIEARVGIEQILANNKGFTVPKNYFEELEQNTENRIAIDEVLSAGETFAVPENYFDGLAENIQSRIAIEEVLGVESFTVPQNYFDELGQNIEARIAVEEVLNTEEVFAVPAGYFEALTDTILQQTAFAAPAKHADRKKRQGIVVKLLVSKAFKYASAACFAMVVGSALYMSEFNNPVATHNRSFLHKQVSKIPNDELEIYLQLNADNSDIIGNVDADTFSKNTAASADSNN